MTERVQIGPYTIGSRLGEGGMGVVYRAESEGRVVALKTVRPVQQGALPALRREITALAALRHPGVAPLVDHGVADGLPWLAMEWVQGPSLAKVLASGTGDLATRLSIVRHLCEALAYVHGEGLVHRDLKPSNVIVTEERAAVLVDFGLQERATGREVVGGAAPWSGTRVYMAPEQLRGELSDARSDLYALGCILYEAITGRRPFAGPPEAVAMQHLHACPPPAASLCPDLDPRLDALVTALLAKRREDRPGSARIVARTLDEVGAGSLVWADLPSVRPYLYRPQLVGRAEPLETLSEHLFVENTSVVLLGGESGEGKTRLAVDLVGRALRRGMQVVTGACRDHVPLPLEGFLRPLLAVADRCRAVAGQSGALLENRAGVLAEYQPALRPWVDESPVQLPAAQSRHRLVHYLCLTLASYAAEAPLLVVIDDLQWADELTLAGLRQLASGVPGVTVLGLYRTEEASEALRALRDELPHVLLDRLQPSSVCSIVADMLAWSDPPERLWQPLATHSEGNPLYVGEYLHEALQSGVLAQGGDGSWQVASDAGDLRLPGSLRELVGRRLRGLPEETRKVVTAAAVLGREAEARLLQHTADMGEQGCDAAIAELFRRHVFEEGDGTVRFKHDKIREVALAALPEGERAETHRAAAEAIEALCGDSLEAHHADLGLHWEIGGDAEKAVYYYEIAAKSAAERHAHDDAQRLYRAALRLMVSQSEIAGLRRALGESLWRQGEFTEALAEGRAAVAAARDAGAPHLEAKSLAGVGSALRGLGKTEEARSAFEEAVALQRTLGNELEEATALNGLGNLALVTGDLKRALEHYELAQAICERLGSRQDQAKVLGNIARAIHGKGRLAEAEQLYDRALRIQGTIKDRYIRRFNLLSLANLYRHRGQLERAEELYLEGLDLCRAVGDRASTSLGLDNLAGIYISRGQGDEAVAMLEEALAIRRELKDRRGEGVTLGNLGQAAQLGGDPKRARALLESALELDREVGNRKFVAVHLGFLAATSMDLGELERAHVLYQDAIERLEGMQMMLYAAEFAVEQLCNRRRMGDPPEKLASNLAAVELRLSGQDAHALWVFAACERGHLALLQGHDGRAALVRAEHLCEQSGVPMGEALRRVVARLRRAVEAPEGLLQGERPEDLPAAVRRQLEGA